jgi:hypothetical protein
MPIYQKNAAGGFHIKTTLVDASTTLKLFALAGCTGPWDDS